MDTLDKHLLNDFQRDFPLLSRPYTAIAERLGVTEAEVIEALQRLQATGTISRIGPVFAPGRIGVSTLAAMAIPVERLDTVANLISDYPEVNHNYQREHRFNLWFVVIAPDRQHLDAVLQDMETRTGIPIMSLPLLDDYHIDLGFKMQL